MSDQAVLDKWLQPFHLPHSRICTLATRLAATYNDLALHSDEQFLATPVTKLPTGDERGEFLAIDLGGSNLRVAFVNLLGLRPASGRRQSLDAYDERIEKYHERSWPIGDHLKVEKAEDLFAWIGDCLAEVIRERMKDGEEGLPDEIPLGIAFSFPMMYVHATHIKSFTHHKSNWKALSRSCTTSSGLGPVSLFIYFMSRDTLISTS